MKSQLITFLIGLICFCMMEIALPSSYTAGLEDATAIVNSSAPVDESLVADWFHQDGALPTNAETALPTNNWMVNAATRETDIAVGFSGDTNDTDVTGLQCANGDCDEGHYVPANDFGPHAAKLMALFGTAKNGAGSNMSQFLNGQLYQCHEAGFGYNDCCQQKGWGQNIGWAGCSSQEKQLGELRTQRRCVYVGNYCAKKVGKGKARRCVTHKQTWCCYESLMARLIQEQGHVQLNWWYGNPKNPQCQGFSLNQFQSLNFNAMNFDELAASLSANVPSLDEAAISRTIESQLKKMTPKGDT